MTIPNNLQKIKSQIPKNVTLVAVSKTKSVDETLADQNLIMSPKSTYIEPKLRSGLVIYELQLV